MVNKKTCGRVIDEKGTYYRNYRPGWGVSCRISIKKGYEVHGIKRRASLFNTDRIDHLYQDPHVGNRTFILHHGDLTDSSSLIHIIGKVQPDEIYNLAAQSHVAVSFEEPEYTANSDALGTLRVLRRSVFSVSPGKQSSIRHRLPSYTARCRRFPRPRKPLFTPVRRTQSPRCMPTGSSSTTAKPMESCLQWHPLQP
jgi:hypothetical protein